MRGAGATAVVFATMLTAPAAAQPVPGTGEPTVTASLSSPEALLGQVFYVLLDVDHAPGIEVEVPAALPLGADLEETARSDRPIESPRGGLTHRFQIALMAFALGEVAVPALPVVWSTAGGERREARSAPLVVRVRGTVAEAEAAGVGEAPTLRDIAPPVSVITEDYTLVAIGGGALGVLLVAAIAWRLVRRGGDARAAVEVADVEASRLAPHEEALARLAAVEASGALDAADRKPVYLELSEIVRAYAGRRFGFGALDLTTAEIRARLATLPDPSGVLERLGDWLEQGDLVKYARGDASEDEARQALYEARIFVERTRDVGAADGEVADAGAEGAA